MTRLLSMLISAVAVFGITLSFAAAQSPEIYLKTKGFGRKWEYAVDGYDTVSYHQLENADADPVKGNEEFQTEYKGAVWLFSSQENLDLFLENPDKYRPAYGGYCAWALAERDILVQGTPDVWHIHDDGRLYLNINRGTQKKWLKDKANFIAQADAKWPGILERK